MSDVTTGSRVPLHGEVWTSLINVWTPLNYSIAFVDKSEALISAVGQSNSVDGLKMCHLKCRYIKPLHW